MRGSVRFAGIKVPFLKYDVSISDPAFAAMLYSGAFSMGPYSVYSALQSPAFYRGVSLICGTIATLPLKTYRNVSPPPGTEGDDEREAAKSFLDLTPAGPYPMTAFDWKYQVTFFMVTEGGVGLRHLYNQAGALIGFLPMSPSTYKVEWKAGPRKFILSAVNGQPEVLTDEDFTHIVGLSLDGWTAVSPVFLFQKGIQLAQAQDTAAMRLMTNGMQVGGLVTADEDIGEDDAKAISRNLQASVVGPDKAGGLAWINRKLKITPWTMTNDAAQFDEGRRYSREDAALMLGLPIYMLNPDKQTSWGTGVAEQNLGLARYTLMQHTSRLEEAISRRLSPGSKFVEFDYKGLLQGTPETEVDLILKQVDSGLISEEEGRELLGFGEKEPNDTFRNAAPVPPSGKLPLEPAPVPVPVASNGSAK